MPNDDAARLWEALLDAGTVHGLIPAGLACRDSLRLEAGMPLYGNELSRRVNAYAAGLGPVVSLAKESDFVGREALAAIKAAGVGSTIGQKLVGLKGLGRRAARGHYPVLKDGTLVGEVTSGQPSPPSAIRWRWRMSTSSIPKLARSWTSTCAARPSGSKWSPCRSTSGRRRWAHAP